MSYLLIELATGNVVRFFPTEEAALEEVIASIKEVGPESVDTLALGYNDPAGPVRAIAQGADLAARALRAVPHAGRPRSSPASLRRQHFSPSSAAVR